MNKNGEFVKMEKNNYVKVSVIIPVYNVEKYLRKCIDSVLAQDYSDYEILLIDDGSTDKSGGICDEYANKYSKVKVFHQENKGLGGARNTGIDNATGEYIIFLDSDDYIESCTLSTLMNKAEVNSTDLVIYNMRTVTTDGKIIRESELNLPDGVFNISICKELIFATISAWSKLYKRDLFIKNNIKFPERYWFEDIWIAFDIFICAERVVKCDEILYNYVMRSDSIMNSDKIKRNLEIIKAFNKVRISLQQKNVWDKFYNEIEYIAINNIYIGTSIRILLHDDKSIYLKKISEYMNNNYPLFIKNKYLKANKIEYMICMLIKLHRYKIVKVLTLIKRRLEGYVVK